MTKRKIREVVLELKKQYQTSDPFIIAEYLDALIVNVPLTGVRGFYQLYQGVNIIYLDESLAQEERTEVCSHELGHMLLHSHINYFFMDRYTSDNTGKYELEANEFASDLLISDDDILENKDLTCSQISSLLCIDEYLIKIKMAMLGMSHGK